MKNQNIPSDSIISAEDAGYFHLEELSAFVSSRLGTYGPRGESLRASRNRVAQCDAETDELLAHMEARPDLFVVLTPRLEEIRRQWTVARQEAREMELEILALN